MLLVNYKARQYPPPTQCLLIFPQSHLYFQAKQRLQNASPSLLDLLMQIKKKSSCMTQSNFFADQQLKLLRNISKKSTMITKHRAGVGLAKSID